MQDQTTIPSIEYLDAIQADNTGMRAKRLTYTNLDKIAKENAKYTGRRLADFWNTAPGSLEELRKARQLGLEFLVATADKAVNSSIVSRNLWADRYTQASMQLFGAPEQVTAIHLIARQVPKLHKLIGNERVDQDKLSYVIAQYESVLKNKPEKMSITSSKFDEADQHLVLHEMKQLLKRRYRPLLDSVEVTGMQFFQQTELVILFSKALQLLATLEGKEWNAWRITSPEIGANISVYGDRQEIRIPKKRSPVSILEAKKLIAHELLVHARRAQRGHNTQNDALIKGFPGYLEAEEGLAIIAGAAAIGQVSQTVYDRYIDIGFAAGIIGAKPKKRSELYCLAYNRRVVRAQAENEKIHPIDMQHRVSTYVDRIYRGSPGDGIGTRQAVYTADIYYYAGLKKMSTFMANKLQAGFTIDQVFDYVSQGRFDPTNSLDTKYVGILV